jgi:hypothetical protein
MNLPSYVELLFRLATRKPRPKQQKPEPSKADKRAAITLVTYASGEDRGDDY